MVRSMSGAMTALVDSKTRRPAVLLSIEDHVKHWASYQTPAVTDMWSDGAIASDGSIVRVSLTRGTFTSDFRFQRITDPTVGSQWSTWTTFSGGSGNMFQDGGCCISNNSGTLRAFAQRGTGGNNIWVWTSSDNGATWSGPVSVLSPPSSALTKGIGSAGNNDVFFLYDVVGGESLGASFFSLGSWGALISSSLSPVSAGSGLGVAFASSIYTIVYSDTYALRLATFNPSGNVWTGLPHVAAATSTAIVRTSPRITVIDGLYTCINIESDNGLLTGVTYAYPRMRQSADLVHWSDGDILHALNNSSAFGAIYLQSDAPQTGNAGARYYIATMHDVYSAKEFDPNNAAQTIAALGPSVLSYKRLERQGRACEFLVELDNAGGVLNALVTSGTNFQPIGGNARILLSEGYRNNVIPFNKVISTGVYRITQIHFERTPEENRLKLDCYDLSRQLDTVARYQNTYTNQTIGYLITEVCARCGLFSPTLPVTSQMSQTVPVFVLHAGRTYRSALDELCSIYDLAYFLDQTETMIFKERAAGESSVWTYQPEIELVSFVSNDFRANHVIVSGKPPTGGQVGALTEAETYDDAHLQLVGQVRLRHHIDYKLTTAGQCASKAAFLLLEEQRASVQHIVTVPVNPALQLLDVVTLTDSAAPTGSGQSGNARILTSQVVYDVEPAIHEQHLALEGV